MLVDKYMSTSRCNKSQRLGAINHNGYGLDCRTGAWCAFGYCCGPRVATEVSLGISCRMARPGVSRFSGTNATFGGCWMRLLEALLVGKPLQICITCAALTSLRHYLCSINYNGGVK